MARFFLRAVLCLLALPLFGENVIAQGGWYWQNPLPQGHHLRAICESCDGMGRIQRVVVVSPNVDRRTLDGKSRIPVVD